MEDVEADPGLCCFCKLEPQNATSTRDSAARRLLAYSADTTLLVSLSAVCDG